MKVGKPKSKRVPVRLRNKIEKASSAKQRKQRKEAKKNPQWRSRLKKDPGIPNLFPYKAKILAEIEESKRRKEEEQMQKRELAKARREGRSVTESAAVMADAEDEELLDDDDDEDDDVDEDEDEDMNDDNSNPMAALLASAQARAQPYGELDEEDETNAYTAAQSDAIRTLGQKQTATAAKMQAKKALPKQALDDPVKAVTLLMTRMQNVADGIDTMIQHYELPPLVTAGSDAGTRFLVEVARKRGRLGRGGIPNLHAAALIVLNDLNDERLHLPTEPKDSSSKAVANGEVTIVKTMAAPFRLEGLWGAASSAHADGAAMAVDE